MSSGTRPWANVKMVSPPIMIPEGMDRPNGEPANSTRRSEFRLRKETNIARATISAIQARMMRARRTCRPALFRRIDWRKWRTNSAYRANVANSPNATEDSRTMRYRLIQSRRTSRRLLNAHESGKSIISRDGRSFRDRYPMRFAIILSRELSRGSQIIYAEPR